jgi:hypothetical protein
MPSSTPRWWLLDAVVVLLVLAIGVSSWGQEGGLFPTEVSPRLRPVITQGHRDGLLLGLDLDLILGGWEMGVGGAFGMISQAGRFRTGVRYGQVAGLSYGDWPTSLVLGRQGEQGIHLTLDLIALNRLLGPGRESLLAEILRRSRLQGTGFWGRLWPGENEADGPEVRYVHLRGFIHWPLPAGIALETQGEFLLGHPLQATEIPFQTFFSVSRLWVDRTSLEVRLGELDNPAGLAGFRFDLGLRSYPDAFGGNRFFLVTLEQGFEVFSSRLFDLDLTEILGARLGWIPVKLRVLSSVFFEGGLVLGGGESPSEVLFGWGTSLSFPDLDVKVHLAVNRAGQPVLAVEAGVLP